MKFKLVPVLLIAVVALMASCASVTQENGNGALPEDVVLKNDIDSLSYALGINIGESILKNDLGEIDPVIFSVALKNSLAKEEVLISMQETQAIIQSYQNKKSQGEVLKNREEGQKFLAENAEKDGITVTASGLQYKVITQGTGPIAKAGETVVAHYHGTVLDGTVFDSSVDRGSPFEFPLGQGQVIRGWDEAFSIMPQGSKWIIYLPADIAYGDNPRPGGPIKPGMTLVFEVELLDIKPANVVPGNPMNR